MSRVCLVPTSGPGTGQGMCLRWGFSPLLPIFLAHPLGTVQPKVAQHPSHLPPSAGGSQQGRCCPIASSLPKICPSGSQPSPQTVPRRHPRAVPAPSIRWLCCFTRRHHSASRVCPAGFHFSAPRFSHRPLLSIQSWGALPAPTNGGWIRSFPSAGGERESSCEHLSSIPARTCSHLRSNSCVTQPFWQTPDGSGSVRSRSSRSSPRDPPKPCGWELGAPPAAPAAAFLGKQGRGMQRIVSLLGRSSLGDERGAVVQHPPGTSRAGAARESPAAGEGWAAAIIQSGATLTC